MKRADLIINGNGADARQVNPLLFGHFIEFMRDCIDEGMWAQLLKNRGFDRRKDIPSGVVDGNPNVAEGWYRTGYKNSFTITADKENSLSIDGFSQKIVCFNDYDGYVGVAQGSLYLKKGKYRGYIWTKGEGAAGGENANAEENTVTVEVCVHEEGGRIYHRQKFDVEKDWSRKEFVFEAAEETRNGIFEIRLLGEGCLWLDGASLMPHDTQKGIWPEVYKHIEELHPPVIRFPGGCFADCYHWEDGIGERDRRPYRRNLHWGGFEDNSFGTDEYMELCRNLDCEPMICVNFGSGTPEEAAAWVEYCNGGTDTYYGRMRAENGHKEPYHIKYWDVGNETFGDWEIGHCSAEEYAGRYLEFYNEMKAKDNSIVFMVCGGDGDDRSQEWNRQISEIIGGSMDAVCLHMYALKSMESRHYDNEDVYYAVVGSVKKYEEILQNTYKTVQLGNPQAKVAVTEYNLGSLIDSYREQTLEAAIFVAGMLNMFIRITEKLSMCNISDLVNGWPGGCIVSKNGHAYGTGSYYVMKMYAESGIRKVFDGKLECDSYNTKEKIGNIEPLTEVPYADAVLCQDDGGRTVIFAINRSADEEMYLKTPFTGMEAEFTEIYSEKTSDMNRDGQLLITPDIRRTVLGEEGIILKPHSVSRIVIDRQP